MVKIKATYDEQFFLETKVYLARDIGGFVLLCNIAFFKLLLFWLRAVNKLRIWSHLQKKSLRENYIFCAVLLFRL